MEPTGRREAPPRWLHAGYKHFFIQQKKALG